LDRDTVAHSSPFASQLRTFDAGQDGDRKNDMSPYGISRSNSPAPRFGSKAGLTPKASDKTASKIKHNLNQGMDSNYRDRSSTSLLKKSITPVKNIKLSVTPKKVQPPA
jgi:hypothetical protein